jgi:hypothetical protein
MVRDILLNGVDLVVGVTLKHFIEVCLCTRLMEEAPTSITTIVVPLPDYGIVVNLKFTIQVSRVTLE